VQKILPDHIIICERQSKVMRTLPQVISRQTDTPLDAIGCKSHSATALTMKLMCLQRVWHVARNKNSIRQLLTKVESETTELSKNNAKNTYLYHYSNTNYNKAVSSKDTVTDIMLWEALVLSLDWLNLVLHKGDIWHAHLIITLLFKSRKYRPRPW